MGEHDVETARIIASVAHDLRSPLNAVIGFSRLLLKRIDGPLTELQAADLEAIHANGQAMLHMIDSLIDLAKAEASWLTPALECVYLHPLLDKATLLSMPLARELGIEIRYEAEGIPPVRGDAQLIQKGIERLYDAVLRLVGGGRIDIDGRTRDAAVEIRVVGVNPEGLAPNTAQILEAYHTAGGSQQARVDATALFLITSQQLFGLNSGAFRIEAPSEHELRVTLRLTPYTLRVRPKLDP